MPIQSSIKNPQDKRPVLKLDEAPLPPVYTDKEKGFLHLKDQPVVRNLRPECWLLDDTVELPCYPSNFHLGPRTDDLYLEPTEVELKPRVVPTYFCIPFGPGV